MKEVHIKIFILVNADVGMRLKVRSGGKTIARLLNGESCILQVKKGQHLKLAYSFPYHATICLKDNTEEEFVIVTYYFREYFPGILFDLLRKILVPHTVNEEEFNRANIEEYKKAINPRQDFEQDIAILVTGFLLSFIYTFLPFNLLKGEENNRDLSFFIGVMGVIGFAMLIEQKKLINLKEYKARVLVFSALSIMLDIILPLAPL